MTFYFKYDIVHSLHIKFNLKIKRMDLVIIKTPDPIFGQEAVCYFNLRPIKGVWHADVVFTESRIGDQGLKTVPWKEIKFLNDPNDERKNGYMRDHLQERASHIEKATKSFKKVTKKISRIKNLLTKEILFKNLLWGMN